ncbi:MAG TPA: DUF11 domain-containing protein [Thermoanaerobaculia bacterium]|nr:DUF11 domain-containing protein [Thermoanaerobaculia bacterium]
MRLAPRLSFALLATLALALPAAWPAAGQTADLSTSKADNPDPVPPGGSITYDIVVFNNGPNDATGVTLTDTLPAGTTFLSLVTDPGWSCITPPVGSGGTVDCSLASLAFEGAAAITLTVAVDAGLTPGTVIENTATAGAEEGDPGEGNNDGIASTTVGSPTPGADLSVTKEDDPDPVAAGAELVYTITVTNSGPDPASGVNLVDSVPSGTTFVSLSEPAGWSCATPAVGDSGDVLCSIASLGVGSAVFTLTVEVDAGAAGGSEIFNSATVSSSSDDPDESDNSGGASTTVASTASPATLSGTKTVSGTFAPGGAVTYTVVLTNSGPETQGDNPGDELTDVLPADLTLVSATATSGTATATVATNTVTWNGSLADGASVTITIDAVIDAGAAPGTTISNQGTIAYDADGNGTNEASAVTDDPGTAAEDDPTSFQLPGAPLPPPVAIPALDGLGLTVLAALLALGGAWVMRRQGGRAFARARRLSDR